ncbi:MAG TPA: OsmC family protein [Thermoanaerobaculia bacterium]|nr:OsmC family protein [Thermoanaerobaculia bacterium]
MTAVVTAEGTRSAELRHTTGFQFTVSFGEGYAPLTVDEPPPLGAGAGPDAARLLAASIGNCLSASLLLCLQKSRAGVPDMRTNVDLTIDRNDRGRLRVVRGRVRIELDGDTDPAKLQRCGSMFEDYCIVTASVRQAFPIEVLVVDRQGREIHRS